MATDKLVDFDHVTDYISREAALSFPFANGQYDHENANEHFINGCESYKEWLEAVPAADVRPVVRGKWERPKGSTPRSWIFRCSVCGERAYFPVPKYFPKGCGYNFCPNCGAEMRNTAALEDATQDADAGAMAPAT